MAFKTTHTGSLPRPDYLLELMFARESGEAIDEGQLDAAIDRATAYVIERQKQAGRAARSQPVRDGRSGGQNGRGEHRTCRRAATADERGGQGEDDRDGRTPSLT